MPNFASSTATLQVAGYPSIRKLSEIPRAHLLLTTREVRHSFSEDVEKDYIVAAGLLHLCRNGRPPQTFRFLLELLYCRLFSSQN